MRGIVASLRCPVYVCFRDVFVRVCELPRGFYSVSISRVLSSMLRREMRNTFSGNSRAAF